MTKEKILSLINGINLDTTQLNIVIAICIVMDFIVTNAVTTIVNAISNGKKTSSSVKAYKFDKFVKQKDKDGKVILDENGKELPKKYSKTVLKDTIRKFFNFVKKNSKSTECEDFYNAYVDKAFFLEFTDGCSLAYCKQACENLREKGIKFAYLPYIANPSNPKKDKNGVIVVKDGKTICNKYDDTKVLMFLSEEDLNTAYEYLDECYHTWWEQNNETDETVDNAETVTSI